MCITSHFCVWSFQHQIFQHFSNPTFTSVDTEVAKRERFLPNTSDKQWWLFMISGMEDNLAIHFKNFQKNMQMGKHKVYLLVT
jgi:hypothetical protein